MSGHHRGPQRPRFRQRLSLAAGQFAADGQLIELVCKRTGESFLRNRRSRRSRRHCGMVLRQPPLHYLHRRIDSVKSHCHASSRRYLAERSRKRRRVIDPFNGALGASNSNHSRVRVVDLSANDPVEFRVLQVENEIRHVNPCPDFPSFRNPGWLRPQRIRVWLTKHRVRCLHKLSIEKCLFRIEWLGHKRLLDLHMCLYSRPQRKETRFRIIDRKTYEEGRSTDYSTTLAQI